MRDIIEHRGVIESIEGSHVRVNIVQQAACSGCKARSLCTSSESKEKIIDVYENEANKKYKIGENVKVCGALSMGKQAVWLAFGLPLVIVVTWMIGGIMYLRLGELLTVTVLLIILAVYFCVLHLNKDRLTKHFAFWIVRDV